MVLLYTGGALGGGCSGNSAGCVPRDDSLEDTGEVLRGGCAVDSVGCSTEDCLGDTGDMGEDMALDTRTMEERKNGYTREIRDVYRSTVDRK